MSTRLEVLREAILKALSESPGGLSVSDLEKKLQQQKIQFWPGEIQEVAWRLTAAKNLDIAASGTISKPVKMGGG